MNWLDVVLICTVLAMISVASKRGLARSAFDSFTVLLAGSIAPHLGHSLSQSIKLSANPHANEADLLIVVFIVITAAIVAVSIKMFGVSEYFDSGFSGLCGAFTGLVLCRVIVQAIALSADPKSLPDAISLSMLGEQFITFSWYRHVMDVLSHFGSGQQS